MANTKIDPRQPGSRSESLWQVARHDFRQPVQSLELLASAMASARTDEARRQCAERTSDLAASLRAMIEGLTLVSRLEAGELAVAPAAVPLGGAVRSAIRSLGAHGSRIEPRGLAGKAGTAPALLATALEGLLLYAAKFAATDSVTVTAKAMKREAVIEIGFDGRHPRSALTSLAFVELPPTAEGGRPSVGLGPVLVSRVAEAMGWRLELIAPSQGVASIILVLPAPAPT